MRSRLEILLLFAALIAVAAFVGSFVAGLREPAMPAGDAIHLDDGRLRPGWPSESRRSPADAIPAARAGPRIRIEVLNGAGRPGLARHATERLRDRGFDVVFFGNTAAADSSVVLDRSGDLDAARAVADALGVRNVEQRVDANLYLDVSVILAADWPPAEAPPAPGLRRRLERLWDRITGGKARETG